jgi:hypothetical protein
MAMILHCYSTSSFVQRSRDGDAESLLDLTPFIPLAYLYVSVMSLMYSLDSL